MKKIASSLRQLRVRLFGLSVEETTVDRRGFHVDNSDIKTHLEQIGRTFLTGYHAALEDSNAETLANVLNREKTELQGYAFEGAAMGLALQDRLTPWKNNRLQAFLDGPGTAHAYMVHIGAGWALARLPWRLEHALTRLDPLLRWLAIDGYGFHEGYFNCSRSIIQHATPKRLTGYSLRCFDQGLGRSLWFVDGADTDRIPATIATFPAARHADLWTGVGLACAYAGGVERTAIEVLQKSAGLYQPHLAQGAAFAAKARQRAGNPAPHTELACAVLCNISTDEAADITDSALHNLSPDGTDPAYEVWRRRIRNRFSEKVVIQ